MANEVYGKLSETVRGVLGKQKPRTGYLGYIIGGAMTIQCDDDPSRVYVRFPDNSYGRYLHKGRIALTPVADVQGTPVACGKDEEGYDAILGVSSAQAPGIIFGRGGNIQIGGHTHGIEDIVEVGDGTPTAGRVLFADGDSWEGTQLEAAIDSVVTGDATGYVKRTGVATYVVDNTAPGGGGGTVNALFTQYEAVAVGNTTTPTTLIGDGLGSATLPANTLEQGTVLRIKFFTAQENATTSPTCALSVTLDSVEIGSVEVYSPSSPSAGTYGVGEITFVCTTDGASGDGRSVVLASDGSGAYGPISAASGISVDTTGTLAIDLIATWDAADAGNIITLQSLTIEVLNP